MRVSNIEKTAVLVVISFLITAFLFNFAYAEQAVTTLEVGGVAQSNAGTVTSQGSYNQYNLGGGGNNFGSGEFPTYDRIGDVSCSVSTLTAKAYGLSRHLNQGAMQLGVTVPLTFGRCRSAQDDQIALMQFNLHQKTVEQHKQDILFQSKMLTVCAGLHTMGYVITVENPLYLSCLAFQPAKLNHVLKHAGEPMIIGYGKPSAHQSERVKLNLVHDTNHHPADTTSAIDDYIERNNAEEITHGYSHE